MYVGMISSLLAQPSEVGYNEWTDYMAEMKTAGHPHSNAETKKKLKLLTIQSHVSL